jgi:hypothetical protein
LTPAEFGEMSEGYKLKSDMEMERLAWQTANLINVHVKKKVTVKQLLGKGPKRQTEEDKQSELEKLKQAIEKIRERQDD